MKRIVSFILRYSGIFSVIRKLFCKSRVTIAVYHDPQPEIFGKHVEYFSQHYNFISFTALVNAIHNEDWTDIPPNSLAITFDDGHKGNYSLLEIFKTYNIHPTIFLCSHVVNTNRHFWWKTKHPNFRELKRLPNDVMLERLRKEVDYEPEKEYSERHALNRSEIMEMLPYVSFGSHTKFHPILTNCDEEKCLDEIANSKKYLEKLLNKEVEHFAYPNGDYGEREVGYNRESCYKSARSSDIGWNDVNSDPYRLKVMPIQDNASINVLCAQLSGVIGYLRYVRYGSYNGMQPPFL